jgi:Tfp pilus assembly protein PilW
MNHTASFRGLSLIETVVAIFVFSIAMLTITEVTLYFYETNRFAVEQAYAIGSARKGVELMVRDIREATYSDEGSYPIIAIGPNELVFYTDFDRDASVERVRYYIDGTNLKKAVVNSSGDPLQYTGSEEIFPISDSVRNSALGVPIFRYFDASGAEVTEFTDVTPVIFVEVHLLVNINPTKLPEDFVIRSSAAIRNLIERI